MNVVRASFAFHRKTLLATQKGASKSLRQLPASKKSIFRQGLLNQSTTYFQMKKTQTSRPVSSQLHDPLGFVISTFVRAESLTSLDSVARIKHGKKRKRYFLGAPDDCNICKESLIAQKYIVDGKSKTHNRWLFMCEECFLTHGAAIGWGFGQLFLREGQRKWLLVGDFSPKGGCVRSTE